MQDGFRQLDILFELFQGVSIDFGGFRPGCDSVSICLLSMAASMLVAAAFIFSKFSRSVFTWLLQTKVIPQDDLSIDLCGVFDVCTAMATRVAFTTEIRSYLPKMSSDSCTLSILGALSWSIAFEGENILLPGGQVPNLANETKSFLENDWSGYHLFGE